MTDDANLKDVRKSAAFVTKFVLLTRIFIPETSFGGTAHSNIAPIPRNSYFQRLDSETLVERKPFSGCKIGGRNGPSREHHTQDMLHPTSQEARISARLSKT